MIHAHILRFEGYAALSWNSAIDSKFHVTSNGAVLDDQSDKKIDVRGHRAPSGVGM
jgi:hypothetical protein